MKIILILISLYLLHLSSQPSHAHTLITDDQQTSGAILHINPDDDPIAGQPNTLFLDMQNANSNQPLTATLRVEQNGLQDQITAKVDGSLATFNYTFPSQGLYTLTFQVTSGEQQYTFTQPWRVSRGITGSALDAPHHAWADIALLTSSLGLILLVLFMLNRWPHIRQQCSR